MDHGVASEEGRRRAEAARTPTDDGDMSPLTPAPVVRLPRPVERLHDLLARPVDELADLVFDAMLDEELPTVR